MTLVGDPRIIFLDEPTTGLDPRSRRTMWEIIRELVADGVTIFLTTQYLEEADQLADRIAVLDRGRLVAEGTPAELKRLVPGRPHPAAVRRRCRPRRGRAPRSTTPCPTRQALTLRVPSDGGVRSLRAVLDGSTTPAIEVEELSIHTPDLDDVFFALTGQLHRTGGRPHDAPRPTLLGDSATMLRRDLPTSSATRRSP